GSAHSVQGATARRGTERKRSHRHRLLCRLAAALARRRWLGRLWVQVLAELVDWLASVLPQGRERIDLRCTARRNVARQQGQSGEQERRTQQQPRVVRPDLEDVGKLLRDGGD